MLLFTLDDSFVDQYRDKPDSEVFGTTLSEVTFIRTYARTDNERLPVIGTDAMGHPIHQRERWVDVCRRVTEGTFSILLEHVRDNNIKGWNPEQVSAESRSFFDLMYRLCWTPPGRGLWMMGTKFVHERGVYEALQNCGFVSTAEPSGHAFAWVMSMLMVGVGIGADTRGAGSVHVYSPSGIPVFYDIPDTRQGWAESIQLLVDSYLLGGVPIEFKYHLIRDRGAPINGFGGFAEGPEHLESLHNNLRAVLGRNSGRPITTETIADIINLIGRCVVAGNVRRSAEILLGDPTDDAFVNLKNAEVYPERNTYPGGWGAFSNNTIFATAGMDYSKAAAQTWLNGEPGYAWLENVQGFGRMDDIARTDDTANGGNPCLEQFLDPWELCTLVELHLPRIANKQEFAASLKAAYLYGKIVTLASDRITHKETREVMMRNRRIGLSCTGITQFEAGRSRAELLDWMDHGYHQSGYWDKRWSQWLQVPESIRRTSVKPSGTVAILSNSTPGIHYPISRYYLRRIRVASRSPLISACVSAGYAVEPAYEDPQGTVVITFPVDLGVDVPSEKDVSLMQQLSLAADVARAWADNAISITAKFDPLTVSASDIESALQWCETRLKSVSFLRDEGGVYPQMPYERIDAPTYHKLMSRLSPLDVSAIGHELEDEFCTTDVCEIIDLQTQMQTT